MSEALRAGPIQILLVEDNPGDVRLTLESFRECRIDNRIHVASDGVEALAFLRRQGDYAAAPRPNLILLDLNLPRKNGLEVLEEVKGDEALHRIPVLVLTTSRSEEDVTRCYARHANCYITKPMMLDQFLELVASIEDFWFKTARLPRD